MDEPLNAEDFLPHVGKTFAVKDGRHAFVLTGVDQGRPHNQPGLRQPFLLIFRGAPGDVLPEGSYRFDVEDGPSFEFYMMPIHTPAADRQDYQASFS